MKTAKGKGWKIYKGNCCNVLKKFPDNKFDAIVSDPPYGLSKQTTKNIIEMLEHWLANEKYDHKQAGFMGKDWDSFVPGPEVWKEVYRVLKPGGHILVFAGTRTVDLMGLAIRLAGFELRDQLQYLYGSGFPKSSSVSKNLDKMFGAERKVVGYNNHTNAKMAPGMGVSGLLQNGSPAGEYGGDRVKLPITVPATDAGKKWEGWGTALKPAYEPIILARKPLDEKTIAKNVLEHGTGAINIDGCRVATEENLNGGAYSGGERPTSAMGCTGEAGGTSSMLEAGGGRLEPSEFRQPTGRWPANVIHDGSEEVVGLFPDSNGSGPARVLHRGKKKEKTGWGMNQGAADEVSMPDAGSGSAARFFYCAKTSKKERTCNGQVDNKHPTVKPLSLMKYLCRLITPPNGLVLDPFMGSGSTIIAARQERFKAVGIELETKSFAIVEERIRAFLEDEKVEK